MKKFYFVMLLAFCFMASGFSQDRLWDFDTWTSLPNGTDENGTWRSGGNGSVALEAVSEVGTTNLNLSDNNIKLVSNSDGALVFEKIAPFDIAVHNAISFNIFAPAVAEWTLEMTEAGANQKKFTITTDASTLNDWHTIIFELDPTVGSLNTKFVLKPLKSTYPNTFFIDDVRFFDFVKPAPTAIEITNTITELTVGKTSSLKLDFTPQEEGGLVDKGVTFLSSNPGVLAVDDVTGVLTAVSAGTANVIVTSKKDNAVTANKEFTVVAVDPANTLTLYNFETSTYVPSNNSYVYSIVDNPSASGINTSSKVLKVESSAAWAWHNWDPAVINSSKVTSLKFKIFSETDIPAFGVEFGINGVGSTTVTELTANTWTEVTINISKVIDYVTTFYIFPKDKWNAGTIYMDDIMLVADDGAGYEPVTAIGSLAGGSISDAQGTLTLTAPTVSPANATNKNFIWKIVSSEPADAATIDAFTGEITAVLNGTIEVKAISEDMLLETTATVTITGQGTGIKDNRNNSVKLSPNPARDIVYISDASNVKRVTVYNLVGSVVMESSIDRNQFDVGSLVKGLYVVVLTTQDNETIATRLMVE